MSPDISDPAPTTSAVPHIGRRLARTEDPDLLTGRAAFTADLRLPELADAAVVAFVRAPLAGGTIRSIDTTEAADADGVLAVVTGYDLPGDAPFAFPLAEQYRQPLFPTETVGFAGQAVAAVVAESASLAADAAELVVLDIAPPTHDVVLEFDDALAQHPIDAVDFTAGTDQPSLEEAEVVVELTQISPRQLPAPIECRTLAAASVHDRLLVWSATQTPHAFRNKLAEWLQRDQNSIRVVAPAVGGGFGGKSSRTVEEYIVPWLALRLGRPVRWDETRSENFATATQGRGERIRMQLGGNADGTITALDAELVKDGGAYPMVGIYLAEAYTSKVANGCYDIDSVRFRSTGVATHRPPTSAYRGAGRSSYITALERMVDTFAHRIGLDPAEVRARNLIRPEQLPYTTPTGAVYDEADYPGDLQRALEHADYQALRAEQAQRITDGATTVLGVGIACYNHMTTGGGGEEASVTMRADGSALVITGTTSQGHGHTIAWAQIAADVLHIPVDQITVVEGDTDLIETGVGAIGSRSLQTAGMAIHRASNALVDQARAVAAELLEASVDDVVHANDGTGFHVVGTPAKAVSWPEVVRGRSALAANTDDPVATNRVAADPVAADPVAGSFDDTAPDQMTCGDFYDTEGRNTFPSGTHVAVVEVDTETGLVTVRRIVTVDDAGTIVNPAIVEGQLHGGIASAVGHVLGEVIVHDQDGNQLTSSFMDYPLPTSDQVPSMEVHVSQVASSFNTLGFKGVGESGTIGATGALQNAVVDAVRHLGVEHIDLPCTPDRVWAAIHR